eukprot:scaffold86531_cov31-Tisochrysis_lutea.AAC.2
MCGNGALCSAVQERATCSGQGANRASLHSILIECWWVPWRVLSLIDDRQSLPRHRRNLAICHHRWAVRSQRLLRAEIGLGGAVRDAHRLLASRHIFRLLGADLKWTDGEARQVVEELCHHWRGGCGGREFVG